MKIQAIEIYRVAMPLVYPFRTAFGNDETIESILVKLDGGDQVGWGEAAPWRNPAYSPEWAAGMFLLLRDIMGPLLLGEDIASGEELQGRLSGIKGNQFAKAALDTAWWDLHAKRQGVPLWKLLGGQSPTVDVGADFGIMESIDLLIATIDEAVQAGFKRVKLKYRPGWELEMIDAVRRAFPTTVFHVDCNSAYRIDDVSMLTQLDRYNLAMIEQPLANDDLIDHAKLQKMLQTPICLDESINSPDNARKAIDIGAGRWVNIKPGRVGGITNALAIHHLCAAAGIPCWVGGMLESSVGAMHCLALATLPNILYPSDIFPTSRFYHQDLGTPEMVLSGPSQMTASPTPGIGAEPNPAQLRAMTLESAVLRI